MSIIRAKRRANFTVIDNLVYSDGLLSFRAMGLLSYLLSKPDNWSVSAANLASVTKGTARPCAINAVHETLRELRQAGFVIMSRKPSGGVDYYVFDTPQEVDDNDDIPQAEKPLNENHGVAEKPLNENPLKENPLKENRRVLINTERQQELKKHKQELSCDDACAPVAPPPLELVGNTATENKNRAAPNQCNASTWAAYRAAYLQAYGVEPLRNAKVNGQVASFVKLVGEDKAPHIAAFYVGHPNHWYRRKGHDFGTLLANAQALATDWQRNTRTTSVQARQTEKTAANVESHNGAIEILKAKGLM